MISYFLWLLPIYPALPISRKLNKHTIRFLHSADNMLDLILRPRFFQESPRSTAPSPLRQDAAKNLTHYYFGD